MARSRRRREAGRKRVELPLDALNETMREHVRALRIESVDAYLAWCRRHRYALTLTRTAAERQRERLQRLHDRASEHDAVFGRLRNGRQLVRELLRGNCERVPREYLTIATTLQTTEAAGAAERSRLLRRLLQRLLQVAPRMLARDAQTLSVLPRVLEHHDRIVREPATWRPRSHNEHRNLRSLVHHLFARYQVPACLDAAWFAAGGDAARCRAWFVHVGGGNNLRTADLPIAYTRKMAHWFAAAPTGFEVSAALRYGQVRGLGGCDRLATAIGATRLGHDLSNDAFWRTVITFLLDHGIRDRARVASIVDFVHEHRFATDSYVDERGRRRELPPLQPNLTMAGRCPDALTRRIEAWRTRFGNGRGRHRNLRWAPGDVVGYREVEPVPGDPAQRRVWTIHELCSGAELRYEGSRMAHCVFGYTRTCSRGGSRIFSLRCEQAQKVRHTATIQVNGREVVQIRGPRNDDVTDRARAVLESWFRGADLSVRRYAW